MARKMTDPAQGMPRSITVGVRLDPKVRYLAELAARKQRRSLSSFIEWVVQESFGRILLREGRNFADHGASIADEADCLWDIDEADRLALLAFNYPDLLTHDEQVIWKLIRENEYVWRGGRDNDTGQWMWKTDENHLMFERLREHWDKFRAVATGQANKSILPTRPKLKRRG